MSCSVVTSLGNTSRQKVEPRIHLLPRDLQVEFDGPQVVDVDGHHLRHGGKQLLGLTDHTAHQHVRGQALQLRHLDMTQEKASLKGRLALRALSTCVLLGGEV